MKLLYTKRSPFARKVRVVALEKNIALDLIDEDLQQKSRRLLDANPLGKVPTLILDNGTAVFDSSVICQYLDGLHDKALMIPRESLGRMEVLKWEAFADDLVVCAIDLYMEKVRHPDDFHKDWTAALEANVRRAFAFIESNLHQLQTFNLASVAVASSLGYIHLRLPHLKEQGDAAQWFEIISKRPSMAQTVPVV